MGEMDEFYKRLLINVVEKKKREMIKMKGWWSDGKID